MVLSDEERGFKCPESKKGVKEMKIIVENYDDALELAEITAERGKERGWREMSQNEIDALADFVGEVGYKGDLYQFTDNYLINGEFVENPTEGQKEDALFVYNDGDVDVAVMNF